MSFDWAGLYSLTRGYMEWTYEQAYNYVDLYYMEWLAWVFYPLIITALLPLIILIMVYASSLFLHLYRLRHILKDAYEKDFWDVAKRIVAAFWDAQGWIWHGYEVIGLEKIPDSGGALIVYYHGAIPIDLYYLLAKGILYKNRHIHCVGDKFLFKIPGWGLLMEVFKVTPGTVSSCSELMNQGQLLTIAPGGVREAYFSNESYNIMWGKRMGFAKIAIESKVPIIPMFTQNSREAFRSLSFGRSLFRWIYEKTRLPIVPIYGGFPVKLRTFLGDPIKYEPGLSPEGLTKKVQAAVQNLIVRHQPRPGNILRALSERFYTPEHCKVT